MGKGFPYSMSRAPASNVPVKKTLLPLRAVPVDVSAVTTGVGWGTVVIGDFPEGNILILGTVANLQFTATGTNATTTFDGDFSIGTTPTADATLSGTDANIIASTALGAATARVSPVVRGALGTPFMVDNTDGSLEMNLNVLIDAANITDDSTVPVLVTGEVYIAYILLGDD
jgi:hypothetical protein